MKIKASVKKLLNKGFEEQEKKQLSDMWKAIEENNTEEYFKLMPDPTPVFWQKYQKKEVKQIAYQQFMEKLSWW